MGGAALGIIVGVIFTFFLLPPLLEMFATATTVPYGEVYEAEARRLQVVSAERVDDEFHVELQVRSNRTWDVTIADWELEISTQSSRIEPLPPQPAIPETSLDFPLGEERTLLLRFPAPFRVDAEMLRLHLSEPWLTFELQPGEGE